MSDSLLRIYLNDHRAGSVFAVEQAEHCIARNAGTALAQTLSDVLSQIRDDQRLLDGLIGRLGEPENTLKQAASWLAEKVQRARPSGDLFGYSDLTRLEELEVLVLGIAGKRVLWETLGDLSRIGGRFSDVDFRALAESAQRQRDTLEPFRLDAARQAFAAHAHSGGSP